MGKDTPQFKREIAPKVVMIGLGSTKFRDAEFTSHEVVIDDEQLAWFEKTIKEYPSSEGWSVICYSHAPITAPASASCRRTTSSTAAAG